MMRSTKKRRRSIILLVCLGIMACLLTALFAGLFTNVGGSYITKRFLKKFTHNNEVAWATQAGSLIDGMVYENVEIRDFKWFSTPNILKIQKITVNVDRASLSGILVTIDHARLVLPDADPIILNGQLNQGMLNVELFSPSLSVEQIKPFVANQHFQNLSGELTQVNITINGPLLEPQVQGSFMIERASKDNFSVLNAPASFDLTLKNTPIGRGLHGFVVLSGGTVHGKKTALITLQKSCIIFDGDPFKPSLAVNATSRVERTKLNIVLTGGLDKPDVQIQSDPPMSKERALLALATNKTWATSDKFMEGAPMTPEMTREFLNYFLFSNTGNKFAQRFGLTDLSVKISETSKGLSASKAILPRLEGTYEIESKQTQANQSNVTQKIGGEFKVTDGLSVEAKKELKQHDSLQEPLKRPEDEIYLKYKKKF